MEPVNHGHTFNERAPLVARRPLRATGWQHHQFSRPAFYYPSESEWLTLALGRPFASLELLALRAIQAMAVRDHRRVSLAVDSLGRQKPAKRRRISCGFGRIPVACVASASRPPAELIERTRLGRPASPLGSGGAARRSQSEWTDQPGAEKPWRLSGSQALRAERE